MHARISWRRAYVFKSSRSSFLKTAYLRLFSTISLRSIYDGSKSQSDASLNSARMPAFWLDDKPEFDGEVYAHPESDLQMRICSGKEYCITFILWSISTCKTKRMRVLWYV